MKFIPALLWIIFLPIYTLSQQHEYIFNGSNGLNTDKVYDVYVDKKDRIWFTTNNGVYQYNAYRFKLFSTQDGLATLFNWQINPDN